MIYVREHSFDVSRGVFPGEFCIKGVFDWIVHLMVWYDQRIFFVGSELSFTYHAPSNHTVL
jgi:hypothetical protein